MRLGLLGLGRIGAFHAETLTSLPAVDSLVVSDPVRIRRDLHRGCPLAHLLPQVADHIAARIASGNLVPGARLPAERDLATEYWVAYDTIRRATALLRDRGLIITIVGRGTYVTPEDQRP
jgi:Bacterial regulatory proteins, gntR family